MALKSAVNFVHGEIRKRAIAQLPPMKERSPKPPKGFEIQKPDWAMPLLPDARYKGVKGGRGSGKSHFFAELLVKEMVEHPNLQAVCIREIQKSLKFSAKKLIEAKIEALKVSHLFEMTLTEIRRKGGKGIIIFQGMQDHTADSIKSLEGFSRAWVEEAQNLSARSLSLLRPTIREEGSQIWFSWNPDQPTDPIDAFLCGEDGTPDGAIVIHANYDQNPLLPNTLRDEMLADRARDIDYYNHVWLGGYNVKSEAQVFSGKWTIDEFEAGADWDGPYLGADFGFAADPTTLVKCWLYDRKLWIEYESWAVGLELDHTAAKWMRDVPDCDRYVIRADSARPESISYLRRHGMPKITSVEKGKGSVEDGIAHLRSYDQIVIHERCKRAIEESRLYSYKVDRRTGDILPILVDKHNHIYDSIRYSLEPLMKNRKRHRQIESVSYATY